MKQIPIADMTPQSFFELEGELFITPYEGGPWLKILQKKDWDFVRQRILNFMYVPFTVEPRPAAIRKGTVLYDAVLAKRNIHPWYECEVMK